MVMMIILIAERIVESMCAVLCMIAFYFQLPAKSLRTYLLSEATSSRCCVDTRHEVLVEACSRFGGSRMHHVRRNLRVPMCLHVWGRSPNGQLAFRNDTYALYHLMCLNVSLMCLWRDLFSFSLLYVLMMSSPDCPTFSLSGMCCFSVCVSLCHTGHLAHAAQWGLRGDAAHQSVLPVIIATHTRALGSLDPTGGSDFRTRSRLTLFVNIKHGWKLNRKYEACLRLDLEQSNKFSDIKQMKKITGWDSCLPFSSEEMCSVINCIMHRLMPKPWKAINTLNSFTNLWSQFSLIS